MAETCPFTGRGNATIVEHPETDSATLTSPAVLGEISISRSALVVLQRNEELDRGAIRRWIVEQKLGGSLPKMLSSNDIKIHAAHRRWSLTERAERLFAWITGLLVNNPVGQLELDPKKAAYNELLAVSDSQHGGHLALILDILRERGWVEPIGGRPLELPHPSKYQVTPAGWLAAESPGLGKPSDYAFIAMWFSEAMREPREAILAAVSEAGYRPVVIDGEEYVGQIVDRILGEIRSARFVVADYTCGAADGADGNPKFQARGGVYYEAGFAHGLSIPLISTVRQDLLGQPGAVHFDVAQYNHIAWSSAAELQERLRNRIGAVVGWGPHRSTGPGWP